MFISPAIDLIEGRPVRLSQGDYSRLTHYGDDPLAQARLFEDAGLSHLHLVDLEGAKAKAPRNLHVLEEVAKGTGLIIDYGGGMYTTQAVAAAFDAGASYVTCGSIAVKDRELALSWMERWPGRIILGADSINGRIATAAWSEDSGLDVVGFIKSYEGLGIPWCIATDVSKDGMLSGPGLDLYRSMLSSTSIPLIASGGISTLDDLKTLASMGCAGAIVGKAYYEGRITLDELKEVEACWQNA